MSIDSRKMILLRLMLVVPLLLLPFSFAMVNPDRPLCNSYFPCVTIRSGGGIGDRLKLVVTGYYLSLLSNRKLYIADSVLNKQHMKEVIPGTFQPKKSIANDFKDPNEYWEFAEVNHHTNIFRNISLPFEKPVWKLRGNTVFIEDVIMNESLRSIKEFPGAFQALQDHNLWGYALRMLFKPSDKIEGIITQLKTKHCPEGNCAFIGVHIRMGDRFMAKNRLEEEDPNEKKTKKQRRDIDGLQSIEITQDDISSWRHPHYTRQYYHHRYISEGAFPCFVWRVEKFIADFPIERKVVVFLTGDAESGTGELAKLLSKKQIKWFNTFAYGKATHVTKETDKDHLRQYLDWWLLSRMDAVVMGLSGFTESAVKYSCIPAASFIDIPNIPEYHNFTQCTGHFLDFSKGGLCNSHIDIWPVEDYLVHFYPRSASDKKKGG